MWDLPRDVPGVEFRRRRHSLGKEGKRVRMRMSRALQAEIGRFDWGQLRCGCGGTAEHVPDMFQRLAEAEIPEETFGADLKVILKFKVNFSRSPFRR